AGSNVLNGGTGNDVLIGRGGDDMLNGQDGRDMVFRGAGQDTLDGGAADDIVLGGTTTYDGNVGALTAILTEWARTDVSYANRVAHIFGTSGGGLNGNYRLNATTVSNDGGATDTLTGGAGLDWFLTSVGDGITDLNNGGKETQTNI